MSINDNPVEAFAAQQGEDYRKFSDELKDKFTGKIVEIYIGDQYETINFDECSVPQNCTIYGKLIEVLDRVIKIDCFYIDKITKEVKYGNIVYINSFQIRAMTEVNEQGSLSDIFLSIYDTAKIKKVALALSKSMKK